MPVTCKEPRTLIRQSLDYRLRLQHTVKIFQSLRTHRAYTLLNSRLKQPLLKLHRKPVIGKYLIIRTGDDSFLRGLLAQIGCSEGPSKKKEMPQTSHAFSFRLGSCVVREEE